MTPSASRPAAPSHEHDPSDEASWVMRHWKTLGVMAAALASAGYLVVSPGERIDKLATQIQHARQVQAVRDQAQDQRIDRLQTLTDDGLREVREDVRDLILAQCLRDNQAIVRARLRCAARMAGER